VPFSARMEFWLGTGPVFMLAQWISDCRVQPRGETCDGAPKRHYIATKCCGVALSER
jgi:hypothetical protein